MVLQMFRPSITVLAETRPHHPSVTKAKALFFLPFFPLLPGDYKAVCSPLIGAT